MPLTPITEFFNGGIVTARDGALLEPGELQQADDCVYRLFDTCIQRAPGRTAYNSTTLKTTPTGSTPAGIKGLAQLTFDGNTDQLLAWPIGDLTNSYMYKSNFTTTNGTFTILTGPGTATCTLNGTTTITAASGTFTNMVVGVLVTGSTVPTNTYITAVNSDTNITVSQATGSPGSVTLAFSGGINFSLSDVQDETLDIVQWENSYFILPKRGSVNRVSWRQFGTNEILQIRVAGLTPVTQAATFSVQAGAGWSTVLGSGFYWFFVTELFSFDQGQTVEAEAGYTANDGRPSVVEITTPTNQFIRITFPTAIKNDGTNGTNRATHWAVYMSVIAPGKAAYPDKTNIPSLATFRRVMTVPIDTTTKDLKFDNTFQGPNLPTTSAAVGGVGEFTNPSGVFTRGGVFASSTTTVRKADIYSGFGFSTSSPYNGYSVTGISVVVVARSGSLQIQNMSLQLDNTSTKVSLIAQKVVAFNTFSAYVFGSQFNNWGITWTPSDIGNLRVILNKDAVNATKTLDVDYLEVVVWYSGATLDTGSVNLDGPPYQVVTYRSQIGTTVNDPANYIIPSASTGDTFSGSLVLNDTNDPSLIRYSLPGRPESFPKPYFLKFDSKKKDIVTLIRKVGQVLIVGMRDSIKRVNYLPTETDVDFQRGIAHEDIVIDHGIVGPLAATLFDLTGSGVVLGYVGYNGFYFTDGITSRPFNLDLKLSDLVKSSALGTSILRVYPREKWLVFYYCPSGASHTKNTKAIVFSYDPSKLKEGGFLPALGPLSISGRSVAEASLGGVPYVLSGHQANGFVYVEDSGITQASGYQVHNSSDTLADAPIIPVIRTRKLYPSGYSRDSREQRVYLLYGAKGSTSTVSSTVTAGSTTVTSAALFGSIIKGMLVTGTGIPPGTVVTTVTNPSTIVISQASEVSATETLTFDNGAIAVTMRGSAIAQATYDFDTYYLPTTVGNLLVMHHDNMAQGLELKISKVTLPDASLNDLNQEMKLYNWTFLAEDGGTEMNRAT